MKKVTIGYIFDTLKPDKEEDLFIKLAKKKGINLVMFNVRDEISEEEIEEKAKECDIIFNNTAGYMGLEMLKTFEELGKKTVDSSNVYYYSEDKWMFYLKCKKDKIPTPETILLSNNARSIKKELKEFNQWPVILKRIEGEQGEFVQKADNVKEAIEVIEELWKKGNQHLPIIAQELVKSHTYRVTVIGSKIVQTALKDGHGWKATAVYANKVDKFEVDKELEKLVEKIIKMVKINICGIDFVKKEGKWVVLEVNAEPSFEFFEDEHQKIINEVLDFIIKEVKK
ncbi:MAG TPA: ATP-grasp domain-containing protein [Candidatus Nanoarchaeia archaeon]|nr:ATP-grasp domain-containing protein [Candidatus Nanoarchaeia archaeon]